MNKYIIIFLFAALALIGCEKDEEKTPVITPEATGTFTDSRDGQEYPWARYGNLEWMTVNLCYETATGSLPLLTPTDDYDDPGNHEYVDEYGFLYSYEGAEEAVPDGWRIPTDEDWQNLEEIFGMSTSELGEKGARGNYTAELMRQGASGSGFNFKLGGFIIPRTSTTRLSYVLQMREATGLYWTSTVDPEKSNGSNFYRQIRYNLNKVIRNSMSTEEKMLSVRCVRDSQ